MSKRKIKTLLLSDFMQLISRKDWQQKQTVDIHLSKPRFVDDGSERAGEIEVFIRGTFALTSTLDNYSITYTEDFSYIEDDPDSLFIIPPSDDIEDPFWFYSGFQVVNEDGWRLDPHDLAVHLGKSFRTIDYKALQADGQKLKEGTLH